MNNKLPAQKGGSDPLNRNPFWKFVVPVSYFAWLPESLARVFCAESLDTSPTRLYADPVQCLADLEGYAPSYISYDVSSHSEWALDFLLGCSTTGVAFLIPF